jgi:hypothetical protein
MSALTGVLARLRKAARPLIERERAEREAARPRALVQWFEGDSSKAFAAFAWSRADGARYIIRGARFAVVVSASEVAKAVGRRERNRPGSVTVEFPAGKAEAFKYGYIESRETPAMPPRNAPSSEPTPNNAGLPKREHAARSSGKSAETGSASAETETEKAISDEMQRFCEQRAGLAPFTVRGSGYAT